MFLKSILHINQHIVVCLIVLMVYFHHFQVNHKFLFHQNNCKNIESLNKKLLLNLVYHIQLTFEGYSILPKNYIQYQ